MEKLNISQPVWGLAQLDGLGWLMCAYCGGVPNGSRNMSNHDWAINALRCAAARMAELRPFEHYSWAHYRQQRERETLHALYDLANR